MKIKELQKTVNIAWSPAQQYPLYLAAGTASQQIDTSLNANSVLEVYSTNLNDAGYDLELKGSQPSQYRFQKVVWSSTGITNGVHQNGLIVGGCESGHLQIYSASKLLSREEALVAHQDKHTGPIGGLDFNPFQANLLASAASESEIFIWDLNNTTAPMTPGAKTQPLEDVQCVAWNKQVQHILASVFSSRCVIWDLRKNEQILKLSDSQSRVRWRAMQWHPEVATQLWLASEEDQAPYVQLWDLRYSTAPTKSLQIHQRGILGLTWCPKDTDLMVSCGKDNKIYCWNPNSEISGGEILSEVATTIQWYSDVQWCPRNPALIASSSLEGNVSIYSLFGGSKQQVQTSSKIADSFPGMDQFAQAPLPQQTTTTVYSDLTKPPKWMKRTAGVSFGFGGRLIAYNQLHPGQVTISQVVTEPDLVKRANQLETTLSSGNFADYCREKADQTFDQHSRFVWFFLKANFEADPRSEMLNLLGYDRNDMSNKFGKYADELKSSETNVDQLTSQIAGLSRSDSSEVEGDQSTDDSTDISGADNNALFDAIASNNKVRQDKSDEEFEYKIKTGEDDEGLICQAILTGNIEAAVELCMKSHRPAEAIIIAITGGSDLLSRTQYKYLKKTDGFLSNIISALVLQDWTTVISQCTVDSWKEALVAALTHSQYQMAVLCEKLGDRLQKESQKDLNLAKNAILCFLCAGNIEKLVDAWLKVQQTTEQDANAKLSTSELQDLVEIVMLMQKFLEFQGRNFELSGKLADFLSNYAKSLASQGALESALTYLGPSADPELTELRSRLEHALGRVQRKQSGRYLGQQTSVTSQKRFAQSRGSISGNVPAATLSTNFNTGLPGQQQQQQQPSWNNMPLAGPNQANSPFNTMSNNTGQSQTMPKPPFAPSVTNEGFSQPPRPSSVGSQGSTPSTRSKYILDPSVTSAPNYGQATSFYNPPQPNSYNTQPFGGAPQPPATVFNPDQVTNNFKPFVPTQGVAGPLPTSNMNNPASYLSGVPPIELGQQAIPPPPPTMRNPTPPPGWNDPPALRSARPQVRNDHKEMSAKHAGTRKWQQIINSNCSSGLEGGNRIRTYSGSIDYQQSKSETKNVNPITHPLFAVDPNQGQNGYPPTQGYQNSNNQYQNQNTFAPPLLGQGQFQTFQPPVGPAPPMSQPGNFSNFQTQAVSQVYQHQQEVPVPHKVEPPKEKLPLPEEFIYMQTVFEELKNQCLSAASDPKTKRKFVDVSKRLESLYDLLREQRLTHNTLLALNDIVQFVQIGDYQVAMTAFSAIVSGPDFAQTASFMPGIKVLIQSASELNVYLR